MQQAYMGVPEDLKRENADANFGSYNSIWVGIKCLLNPLTCYASGWVYWVVSTITRPKLNANIYFFREFLVKF